MPCMSSDGIGSSGYDYAARRDLERLTRVSCEIMGALEKLGLSPEMFGKETQDWWASHKAADERRREAEARQAERERLRDSGIAKLSDAERRALGL